MTNLTGTFSGDLDAPGGGDLNVVRLTENPVVLTVFTQELTELKTHFVNESKIGEVRCNQASESRCVLCDIGNGAAARYLLPVYVVSDDEVQVLAITATCRPYSLGPQLAAEFEKGELDKRFLQISKTGYRFAVKSMPASEGSEMGEVVIKRFCEELDAGKIELKRAIPVYGNKQLLDVPEIERVATAMGISRAQFAAPDENGS